jgi:uncharacterized membrane protein YkoI
MKTRILLTVSALFAAWCVQAAERVDPRTLPAPVKSALGSSAKDVPIKEVTIHTVDGRTVYDVELERAQAPNPHLRIAADGTVLRDSRQPVVDSTSPNIAVYPEYPAVADIPRLQLSELPAAVQRTINKEAGGREVTSIASDVVNGRPAYRVEFGERGRNPRLFVAENGSLLQPPEKPPMLGLGTTFARTPPAVQQTIRREIGSGEILKIDKEGLSGPATIYKVEMKNEQGAFELHVSENGKILKDTRR